MKRRTAIILALIMLLSTGCGTQSDTQETTTAAETQPEVTDEIVTDDLGDIKFDGEEFTIYLAHPLDYLEMEEETGDTLDDAVFERNRLTEERLGIELVVTKGVGDSTGTGQNQEMQTIRSLVMSGDDTNDIFIHVQHSGMPGLITEGCFVDWNTVPNINFDKPYWYTNCIRDINYGDKVFTMSGMYNLNILTTSDVLLFNKRLCDEAQMEYPYDSVLDGSWTYDKFLNMIKTGTRDLNGDTLIDEENDQLGYWGWGWEQIPALFIGLGGDVLTKDSDGQPVIAIETERNVSVVEKMQELFATTGAQYEMTDFGGFFDLFKSGKLLFLHSSIKGITDYRDMTDDFGFIPYPKLDETQEEYKVRVGNCAGLTYIPVTNSNLEFTGAVLEVMSAISYNTVMPAFFDIALTVKSTRDTESEQMIPILNSCTSFYDEASAFSIITLIDNNKALSTYYAEIKNEVEKSVADIIEAYN